MSSKGLSSEKSSSIDLHASNDPEKAITADTVSDHDGEEDVDPNIVDWDGPNDSANPLNWSLAKKSINIAILSAMTFLTPLASSMFAPGIPEVMKEFGSDRSVDERRCSSSRLVLTVRKLNISDIRGLGLHSRVGDGAIGEFPRYSYSGCGLGC